MIPDFKTFIKESIWSDIQDRSMGKTVRREDDVDLMSGEDFCDYLNDNYISKSKYKILYSEHSKCIHIPILNKFIGVLLNLSYNYEDNKITMNYDEVESLCPELCKKIKKNFKVDKEYVNIGYTKFIIFPPDGSECTNRFFIDVINFIIDNADENVLSIKKKYINESIWSDIQDRSSGQEIRKEDVKPQDYENWWRNITLDDAPKYKPNELRLYDFLYETIIWKLEKTMNIKNPNMIRIYFRWEDAWYLSIFRNTSYGVDNYTMEANGVKNYNPIKYSIMNIDEKRSIRYRLEKRKFYVYPYSNGQWTEYFLRQEEEYKGEKGIPLI